MIFLSTKPSLPYDGEGRGEKGRERGEGRGERWEMRGKGDGQLVE